MNIDQLIIEARERQIEETNAQRAEQEARAEQAAQDLNRFFFAAFGEGLYSTLGAGTVAESDARPHIVFGYQDRAYNVRRIYGDGMLDWHLTRMDFRNNDDERRRPSTTITVYRSDMQHNIDAFALALSDLDQEPEVPCPAPRTVQSPAPAVSEQGAAFLEALRVFLQSEI